MAMTKAEMLELAENLGIEGVGGGMTKAQIAAKILEGVG